MESRLRVGLISRVEAVDPHRALQHNEGMVQRQVFESLYRRSEGRAVPDLLARRLRPTDPQGGGFEAPLRPGVRLSDGSELTAEHVCASLRRSSAVPAELEVQPRGHGLWFSPARSLAELCDILSSPMAAIAKFDGDSALGTGPFAVERRVDGLLSLCRNPHHVGATASVEGIDLITYDSAYELGHALARGELDYTSGLSSAELPRGTHVRKSYVPTPSTTLLWINTERVPDPELRQAIACALDKRRLLDLNYPGVTGLSTHASTPPSLGGQPDQLELDLERSLELLAGRRPRLRLRTIWGPRPYMPDPHGSTTEITRQLSNVGFDVQGSLVSDAAAWRDTTDHGDFELALGGWYADEPSLAFFLSALYGSENIPRAGESVIGCNFSRFADAYTDELLTRFRATGESETLAAIAARVRLECPVVALHHGATTVGLGPRVVGREFDELAFPVFSSFTLRRATG